MKAKRKGKVDVKKKFSVYAIYSCCKFVGDFEAETADAAEELADATGEYESHCSVCHQCADECGGEAPQFLKFHVETKF